jgi:hypothetical protein
VRRGNFNRRKFFRLNALADRRDACVMYGLHVWTSERKWVFGTRQVSTPSPKSMQRRLSSQNAA